MRILVCAYACEPERGSEPGVGWNWARELARDHEVHVLTRENNRQPIERELKERPQPNMHFLYLDLPDAIRRWKRGQRGIHMYYYAWQIAARRRARTEHRDRPFDVVHHLTFASAFTPALTWLPDVPFVWGPVGGGVRVPWRLAAGHGAHAILYEALRSGRRFLARYADPLLRMTWRRADLILVQNPDTLAWIPRRHRIRARVHPNAGIDELEFRPHREEVGRPLVVAAGRLIHLKAFSLAVRAVAELGDPRVRLVVAGEGPERDRLGRLAWELGIADRVEFVGSLPRQTLLELFAAADVFLFPSLHDESPLVVAEAMAQGAVPVVLDLGGSSSLVGDAGFVVPARGRTRREVVRLLANALREATARDGLAELRAAATERARVYCWPRKPAALAPIVTAAPALDAPRT
jgi:glycosyltransferase involved in cell wall biosynthesis